MNKKGDTKSYYLSKPYLATNWMSSYNFCLRNKLDLLTIDDTDELNFFYKLFEKDGKKILGDDYYGYFAAHIGTVCPPPGGNKTNWSLFKTAKKVNYIIRWGSGEPNAYRNMEECQQFITSYGNGGFNDYLCFDDKYFRFICHDVKSKSSG